MSGKIYFLRPVGMIGPIKIGFAQKPARRLSYYMSLSPFPLEQIAECAGSIREERAVHNHFADCLSHAEWFHPIPRLLEAIAAIQTGAQLSEAIDLGDFRGSALSKKQLATRAQNGTASKRLSTGVAA